MIGQEERRGNLSNLLNLEIEWHEDVAAGGKIKCIHDEYMVKKELLYLVTSEPSERHKLHETR